MKIYQRLAVRFDATSAAVISFGEIMPTVKKRLAGNASIHLLKVTLGAIDWSAQSPLSAAPTDACVFTSRTDAM
jgi:hypothetical protein